MAWLLARAYRREVAARYVAISWSICSRGGSVGAAQKKVCHPLSLELGYGHDRADRLDEPDELQPGQRRRNDSVVQGHEVATGTRKAFAEERKARFEAVERYAPRMQYLARREARRARPDDARAV